MGGKESKKLAKELEAHPLPLLGALQKHQANSRGIYTEDLLQTQADPVLAASFSASPFEPCLIDSVGYVLLVSPIPSDSYGLSSHFSMG